MSRRILRSCALGLCQFAIVVQAAAQNEQFIPVLTYRTGAYAVSGVPYANGEVDYYKLVNAGTAASTASKSSSRSARPVMRPIGASSVSSA